MSESETIQPIVIQKQLQGNKYAFPEKVFSFFSFLFSPKCMNCKIAFTLAEVLISLGIIGVVAAITLPTLVANYQKKVLTTRLKKEVNILANNFQLLFAKEGIDNLCNSEIAECSIGYSNVYIRGDKYGKYFKLSEVPINSLFYESMKDFFGANHVKAFNLADGSCVAIDHDAYILRAGVVVDVNCDGKPNKWGRDMFIVGFNEKGKIFGDVSSWANGEEDLREIIEMCENYNDSYSDENIFLGYCSYKIAQDGWEMKY